MNPNVPINPQLPPSTPQPSEPSFNPKPETATPTPVVVYGGYFEQPSSPSHTKLGSTKIIVITLVAFALVGAGIFAFFSLRGNDGSQSNIVSQPSLDSPATSQKNNDVFDRPDGTLDLTNLVDANSIVKTQSLNAKLGQQINLSDGTSYMVTGVERNFTAKASKYLYAYDGMELIKVSLVVGNRAKEGITVSTDFHFLILDSENHTWDAMTAYSDAVPDILRVQQLVPGQQDKGSLIFQVKKDEKVSLATIIEYDSNSDSPYYYANRYFGDIKPIVITKDAVIRSKVNLE